MYFEEKEKKIEGVFEIPAGLKTPLLSKLGKFQLLSNQKIPKQKSAIFKRQHQKWLTW